MLMRYAFALFFSSLMPLFSPADIDYFHFRCFLMLIIFADAFDADIYALSLMPRCFCAAGFMPR